LGEDEQDAGELLQSLGLNINPKAELGSLNMPCGK
jgi:hypothetical protein